MNNNNNLECPHCHDKGGPEDWFGKLNIINQKRHTAKCLIKCKPIQSASPILSQFFNLSATSSSSLSLHITTTSTLSTPFLHMTSNSSLSSSAPSLYLTPSISFSANDTHTSERI